MSWAMGESYRCLTWARIGTFASFYLVRRTRETFLPTYDGPRDLANWGQAGSAHTMRIERQHPRAVAIRIVL